MSLVKHQADHNYFNKESMVRSPYKRVMVKFSGDVLFAFNGAAEELQHDDTLLNLLMQIKNCQQQGVQLVVICGGGNICRGQEMVRCGIKRTTADNIGMLSTLINSLIIREKLSKIGCPCVLFSAFAVSNMCAQFETFRAIRALEDGNTVICAGGTGNPFVTTDTASTLRAVQTEVEAVIKLTKVNGLYDKDPNKYADAVLLRSTSYDYCLEHQLKVMDLLAYEHCKNYDIPIHIASFKEPNILTRLINGASVGTKISNYGE